MTPKSRTDIKDCATEDAIHMSLTFATLLLFCNTHKYKRMTYYCCEPKIYQFLKYVFCEAQSGQVTLMTYHIHHVKYEIIICNVSTLYPSESVNVYFLSFKLYFFPSYFTQIDGKLKWTKKNQNFKNDSDIASVSMSSLLICLLYVTMYYYLSPWLCC